VDFARAVKDPKPLRIGVATNLKAHPEVAAAFAAAVETVARLGHAMTQTVVPFAGPSTGISHIERDRKAVSRELFGWVVRKAPAVTPMTIRIRSHDTWHR
jgi:Asp-tRNA(Asn)/Glu-tRNA(Gln) amidotransferase A subunit family amidase